MVEDVEVFYLDEQKEEKKGVFKLRRLLADEATNLYDLCQRKNTRTGVDLGTDNTKYIKLKLAAMVVDCPLTYQLKPWKDLDLQSKAASLGQSLEEDMYARLMTKSQKMKSMSEEDENL